MNDSFRFVSFADARFADAIVGPRAAPRSVLDHRHRRAPVRPRVGASACRARARSTRRDARKTEKPKNRKTEKPKNRKTETEKPNRNRKRTSTATISRASEVRQNPSHWVNSLKTTQKPVGRTPMRVARRRRATPQTRTPRDVERRGRSAGAGDGTRRGGASTTTRASDRRARGSARTARAGERRARDEGARAIGGEADDARRRRERDGTGEGDRTTTTTRTMGSR